MKNLSRYAKWLFLIGLGTQTQIQIGGYIGISEIFLVIFAPLVVVQDFDLLKRDGVLCFIMLSVLWILGAFIANQYNSIPTLLAIKGIATPIVMTCAFPCVYVMLRKDPGGLKWALLGYAISSVVSIFIFQPGTAHSSAVEAGQITAMESVVSYKLFWINLLSNWLSLPIKGWYLSMPHSGSMLIAASLSVFALLGGGRSIFLILLLSTGIMAIGGTTRKSMKSIKRHLWLLLILVICLGGIAKVSYKYAVTHGLMSESEIKKYERQSKGGQNQSVLNMLMAGRSEVFVSIYAISLHPIIGMGSWALDYDGIFLEYLREYGDEEDYLNLMNAMKRAPGAIVKIPCHSHIFTFWMWHGIFGCIYWLYVLCLITKTFLRRMHVVPEYFGYFALMIPATYWNIFFSPLGQRPMMCLFISACFVVRKIERDQLKLGMS